MELKLFPTWRGRGEEEGHAGAYPFGKFGLRWEVCDPSGGRPKVLPRLSIFLVGFLFYFPIFLFIYLLSLMPFEKRGERVRKVQKLKFE